MFEKRPIWGLVVGLNVCILIWLISVQEPVMLDMNTSAISSSSSSGISASNSNNFITNVASADKEKHTDAGGAVKGGGVGVVGSPNGWIRDLLSKSHTAMINNEYKDDDDDNDSTITTLTDIKNNNNNNKYNSNSNNNKNTNNNLTTITITTTAKTTSTTKISRIKTTKTSDISSDMQSLTSSLGTGILAWQTKPTPSWSTLMTAAAASALPDEDFNHLIDLHNFQFLMAQPVCGNHVEGLILIHSAPKNYEKRQVIRETWASITHHMATSPLRILFLLGAVTSSELQEQLQEENNLYRDIIQGSFIDDYRNMTYKHIMAFKWFLYNCPQAQILIKVDDDVYVNTPQLIMYLKEQKLRTQKLVKEREENPTIATTKMTPNINNNNTTTSTQNTTATTSLLQTLNMFSSILPSSSSAGPSSKSESLLSLSIFNASQELFSHPQNLLFCQKIIGSLVKRSYRSKWRVSFKEYSEHYYPPYCPGYAIIYSPDIILRLYTAAQKSKYFWIDDVHITGVLAQQTNTTITTSSHYVLYSDECDQILTGKTDLNKMEFLFAWHSISAQKIKLLWHLQMLSSHYNLQNDLQYNQVLYEQQQQQQKLIIHNDDVEISKTTLFKYTSFSSTNGLR